MPMRDVAEPIIRDRSRAERSGTFTGDDRQQVKRRAPLSLVFPHKPVITDVVRVSGEDSGDTLDQAAEQIETLSLMTEWRSFDQTGPTLTISLPIVTPWTQRNDGCLAVGTEREVMLFEYIVTGAYGAAACRLVVAHALRS